MDQFQSEHELQRNKKGPLNCKECRRLKIRCDRQVPCGPCTKRGVASLCPDGVLASKGSRLILANTEELHKENERLRNRVRELETALETLQAKHSDQPHPLLAPQLLITGKIRHESDDPNNDLTLPTFGSLTIGDDGTSKFYGTTGGAEWFVEELQEDTAPIADYHCGPFSKKNAPSLGLVGVTLPSLPEPADLGKDVHTLRPYILSKLPPKEEALRLTNLYYERVAWLYNPVPRTRFFQLTFNPCYANLSDPPISHHNLALLFSVFSLATLLDVTKEPHDPLAHEYMSVARACLVLECIYVNTTCTTVEVMILQQLYLTLSDDPGGAPKAWAILGTTVKMAEAIGLHRDPAPWGLDEEEVVRRRRLMWELLSAEFWSALGFGRPPTITKGYMDAQMPMDTLDSLDAEPNFHRGKHHFVYTCLMPIIEQVLSSNDPPNYAAILKLDKKTREWTFPDNLQLPLPPNNSGNNLNRILQRTIMFSVREITLLYLHRAYFAHAVMEPPYDPLRSKYARSVLAAYGSACAIIGRMRTLYAHEPQLMERFSVFWSHSFSALVTVASIVSRAPGCPLSSTAIVEVDQCVEMFKKAAHAYRPGRFMPTALRLQQCAHEAYRLYQEGRWVAPLHENEPPGLGSSKAVTRYAHRQRTPLSTDSAHSGSPANSGDASGADSSSDFQYEHVQPSLEEYIRSWSVNTTTSNGADSNGAATDPLSNIPIQPPTSDAFLQGVLTGNWNMQSAEDALWGRDFGGAGNPNHISSSAPAIASSVPNGAYETQSIPDFNTLLTYNNVLPLQAAPPSTTQQAPQGAQAPYMSPNYIQPNRPVAGDAFSTVYGDITIPAHQEAAYNAGMWDSLTKGFNFN